MAFCSTLRKAETAGFKVPNSSHANEVDINMLIRICDINNEPLATNEA
jgi:methylglyoxal synthase